MVCQESKAELVKDGRDFEQHVEHEHDLWKYANYLAYLSSKDAVDQSGLENIVWESYSKKLVTWMPSNDIEHVASNVTGDDAVQSKSSEDVGVFLPR